MKQLTKHSLAGMELTPSEATVLIKWFAEREEEIEMINTRVRAPEIPRDENVDKFYGKELLRLLDRAGGDPGLKPFSMSFDTKGGPVLVTMERMVGGTVDLPAKDKLPAVLGDIKRFEDLTSDQVNDLIADKVMGYGERSINQIKGLCYLVQGTNPDGFSWSGNIPFNPYKSLDSCFKVEEKLAEVSAELCYKYRQRLLVITSRDHRVFKSRNYWEFLHATPRQKCEAMLRAIGEVE